MRFVDRDLARRLKRAWTWLGVECAPAFAAWRHPDAVVAVEPVAGGRKVPVPPVVPAEHDAHQEA
jgi:hypothetical protein